MSGLAAVLAGRHDTGVYTWHAAFDVAEVAHTVEHAGWRFAHVDGWTVDAKADVLAAFASALDFPDHFGGNLDALADCLADLPGETDGTIVLWDGWSPFARADEAAFRGVLEVLSDRASEGSFAVLLRGAGPEVDVPSLD